MLFRSAGVEVDAGHGDVGVPQDVRDDRQVGFGLAHEERSGGVPQSVRDVVPSECSLRAAAHDVSEAGGVEAMPLRGEEECPCVALEEFSVPVAPVRQGAGLGAPTQTGRASCRERVFTAV